MLLLPCIYKKLCDIYAHVQINDIRVITVKRYLNGVPFAEPVLYVRYVEVT